MKFDMGAQTLSSLRQQTAGASQDLGTLVRALVVAGEPLEGRFNGAGRAGFDAFKLHADQIARELNTSLSGILHGQTGAARSFSQGDQQMAEDARTVQLTTDFDAARFGNR
ncbi:hypothetical protein SAMN05892883_0211 [Jatrophihabitans sp. GAS493]|uniref:hypothetical protein n=1 Tax=Jatrophihabitans sp. GAS493 TaxID=1907575 RepID=UPI000BB9984C|nr:hypothetical protein [Jatrophihabitans sp. GAS493]SOD70520.1 hypothetical protein SAMN05892883_0211 [Jatrophihabitans sp. GAS493]